MTNGQIIALDEWHAWRRRGIGGSDIAALIGLSRWASPTSVFYERQGLLEARPETQRQRIGKRIEAVLAAEFHDATGLYVVGEQAWCEHPDHDWARCTVDGFADETLEPTTRALLGTVQMKTDGRFGWPDGIPADIQAQCVWEMGVTQVAHCWLVVMFAGFRVEVFEIEWDDDARADWTYMLAVAERFWRCHVLAGVPPPLDDHEATTKALTEVFRDPDGELEADIESRDLVLQLQLAKVRTKAAEAAEATLANELRAWLGDKTDLVDGWKPGRRKGELVPNVIASWREQQARRVDLDGLRAAHPLLVEEHTNVTTTRVLRVAKLKED